MSTRPRQTDALRVLGLHSRQSIRDLENRARLPRHPKGTYSLEDLLAWQRARHQAEIEAAGEDAATATSGALERLREWRARQAEVEYKERVGALVDVADLRAGWLVAASVLRRCGETLLQRFGEQAAEVFNSALKTAEQQVKRTLGGTE